MTRCTLAREVVLTGNAVRTHGGLVTLRLLPGDEGFVFVRDDTGMRLAATLDNVIAVPNATALGQAGRPEFLFTEHVLSALAGLGYTDAEVHVDCAEVPLLDGSALPIVAALDEAGRAELDGEVEPLTLATPVVVERDGRRIEARPDSRWSVDYAFDHPHPLIGRHEVSLGWDAYRARIAPARTFATVREIEALTAQGLISGGSEDNLLVVHDERLSSPLRDAHEFALHKVLDLIGDLALLGRPVTVALRASKTGHAENQALARALRSA